MNVMGVGSCYASLPFVPCEVCEDGVSHLSGSCLIGLLGASALVVIVDHLVASVPKMPVQRALGVEVLKAFGALVVALLDGRHGVRWSM